MGIPDIVADAAKSALAKAIEAFEKAAELGAEIRGLRELVVDFKADANRNRTEFEARTDRKLADFEARVDRKLFDFEARLRQLESRMSQAEGAITSALGDAYKHALANKLSLGPLLSGDAGTGGPKQAE